MNIHTLHIQHVMLLAVFTLLTVINSLLYRGTKGIRWFTLYNFFALLGSVAVAFRNSIPDFLSIVGGNLSVIAAYSCLFASLCLLFGFRRRQLYVHAGLVLFGLVTMLYYGWIHPNTPLRLLAYSFVLGAQQLQIVLQILRKPDGTLRHIGSPMALMMGSLAFVNLIRFLGVTISGAPSDYLQAGPFLAWIVPINTGLQCGAMVAYVWMTSSLLRHELQIQASTDPLTGLLNRRAMEVEATQAVDLCFERNVPVSAVVFDLDNFKPINDTLGHKFGDITLVAVADCLRRSLRTSDLPARIGGDEFAAILPRTSIADARAIVERLRAAIEALQIGNEAIGDESTVRMRVTASFGIAEAHTGNSWDQLLVRCDKSLYAAKRAGGNTIFAPEPHHDPTPNLATA